MNPLMLTLTTAIVALGLGVMVGYLLHRYQAEKEINNQQEKAESIHGQGSRGFWTFELAAADFVAG